MPIVYPTTDIVTSGVAIDATTTPGVANGDLLYIAEGIDVVSTSSNAIDLAHAATDIYIAGSVAGSGNAINLDFDETGTATRYVYSIQIAETGSVTSASNITLYLGSNDQSGAHYGEIEVVNHGAISSFGRGTILMFFAADARLTNTGTISAIDDATAANFSNAVRFYGVDNAYLTNAGQITGSGVAGSLADAAAIGANGQTESFTLINSGVIEDPLTAIHSEATTGETIVNTGQIFGDIVLSSIAGQFTNSGQIVGDIDLGNGGDTFDGRGGTVTGEVLGGLGDDTFIIDNAATAIVENAAEGTDTVQSTVTFTLAANFENLTLLGGANLNGFGNDAGNTIIGNQASNLLGGRDGDDSLRGEGGDDTLVGGNGRDTLSGGDGNDNLQGNADNDKLYGLNGDDSLRGGFGDDSLYGQNGNDTLIGEQGADFLGGGGGADVLDGGAGFDTLNGSSGDDNLTGGLNADTFVFDDTGGGFGNDTITDFEETNDLERIDLAGVAAITDFTDLSTNHMTQVGANVVIDDLAGNTITLLNVAIGDLQAVDFLF